MPAGTITLIGMPQFANSDRLIKQDIKYIEDVQSDLAQVLAWKPVTFNYSKRGVIQESGVMRGFIAQDLLEVSSLTVNGETP